MAAIEDIEIGHLRWLIDDHLPTMIELMRTNDEHGIFYNRWYNENGNIETLQSMIEIYEYELENAKEKLFGIELDLGPCLIVEKYIDNVGISKMSFGGKGKSKKGKSKGKSGKNSKTKK